MSKAKEALNYYKERKCNCAQAVVAVFEDETGIPAATAEKLMTTLGMGMGGLGQVCGALSGAFVVLSRKLTEKYGNTPAGRNEIYAVIKEMGEEFKNETGSLLCPELKGKMADHSDNKKTWSCPALVEYAAGLAEKYLSK